MNELHDSLFKLFILASNGWCLYYLDEYNVNHSIERDYPFQYSDKSNHPVEYEVRMTDGDIFDVQRGVLFYRKLSVYSPTSYHEQLLRKATISFEEME